MPLSSFQGEVLEAFFRRERRFFITGGAALAGFHLHHRNTKDLDLFATEGILDDGVAALRAVAAELGASIEAVQTAETFRRFLLRRGADSVIVDLVRDLAPQLHAEKQWFGEVRVDPPDEILANKLCALLSRAELRDLVDVYALLKEGYSIETGLAGASKKDGGMSAAQLAWVLSEVQIGDDARPPGLTVEELRSFLEQLQDTLTRLAYPGSPQE